MDVMDVMDVMDRSMTSMLSIQSMSSMLSIHGRSGRAVSGLPLAVGSPSSRRHPMSSEGLALEAVVAVGVAAVEQCHEARQEVGGEKERTPALVLAHVDPLVDAGALEALLVAADHHVAEGEGGGAADAAERGQAPEEPGDRPPVGLDHAGDPPDAAVADRGEGQDEQPQQRVGGGPGVAQGAGDPPPRV